MKPFLIALLCLWSVFAGAQVKDDFSDGDFTSNPGWSGTTTNFQVNSSKQLQLNATAAGIASLSTPDTLIYNTEWNFYVRLAFSPSGSNFMRFYLVSDKADLTGSLNGYYIQIGETGSADGVDLYKQAGTTRTLLVNGTVTKASKSNNIIRVGVTRDSAGKWTVYSDSLGGTNYAKEGSAQDAVFTIKQYTGIYAKYTSSNITKVYWDDIVIKEIVVDKTPPQPLFVSTVDSSTIEVHFSEPLDSSAEVTSNYSVISIGQPGAAIQDPVNKNRVRLYFANAFQTRQSYTLEIKSVKDVSGNAMPAAVSLAFMYYQADRGDVVITEIMSEPKAPNIPVRYLELFNRSSAPILLQNWQFEDAVSGTTLPSYLLLPDSFVVMCSTADSLQLSAFCRNIIALKSFPTLNITSDSLFLYDETGELIHFLHYTNEWHADDLKKAGGWSLELKDANNVCNPEGNWTSSTNTKGGTPGKTNSVKGTVKDNTGPELLKVIPTDSITLMLYFSEALDSNIAAKPASYQLTDNTITVISAEPLFPDFRRVSLKLGNPLSRKKIYGLTAKGTPDCSGNITEEKVISFGLPEPADSFDIVINELLFNPETGGVDFVELYNRSDKIIDLRNFYIATADDENIIREPEEISGEGYLLLPESYCVLTTDKKILGEQYYVPNPETVIEVSELPGMLDDEGTVVLVRKDDVRIDQVDYSDDWHFSLLHDHEGVSLERLNPSLPSQDKNSWHSASSAVGYATPTYINSQYQALSNTNTKNPFSLEPPVFSPDGDGYQDVLNIQYAFDNPGHMATIEIFDREGREVRTLLNNQILGTSGYLNWDGLTDNGDKARIGVYILLISTYTSSGETEQYKLVATLVGKF